MVILYATLLALFAATRLVIQVKTVQLFPVAISGEPAMVAGLERRACGKFPKVRSEYR
jgi:hypothetical protein